MAGKRMISSGIAKSKKVRKLDDRGRFVFVLLCTVADRDAIVPADPDDLYLCAGAALLYSPEEFSGAVDAVHRVGLLELLADVHGRRCYFIRGWHGFNKLGKRYFLEGFSEFQLAREVRERLGLPEDVNRRGDHRDITMSSPGAHQVITECSHGEPEGEIEVEVEKEGEGEIAPPAPPPARTRAKGEWDPAAERSRILRCFQAAAERDGRPWAPRPYDDREIKAACLLGSCSPWGTDEELSAEFARTIDGARSKGLDPTLAFVLNHVGESWGDRQKHRGTGRPEEGRVPEFNAEAHRKEMEELK